MAEKKTIGKVLLLLIIAALVFALFGCTQSTGSDKQISQGSGLMALDTNKTANADRNTNVYNNLSDFKKAKEGDTVKVDYTGRFTDGTIFDTSTGREPLEFTVGAGQMIKGFDAAVVGMKVGDKKTITLQPADAYGEYKPELVATIDANNFGSSFTQLKVGMTVMSSAGYSGVVKAITDKNATIDFNPEMAGKVLVFDITMVSIQ